MSRRRSFRVRLVAMMIALVAIPIAVIGWRLIDLNRDALREASRAQLTAVVTDLAIASDRALDRSEATLTAIAAALAEADAPPPAEVVDRPPADPTGAVAPADPTAPAAAADLRIEIATRLVGSSPDLFAVGIHDRDGAWIADLGKASGVAHVDLPADLRERARVAPPAIGPAFAGPDGPRVLMVVPIRGRDATWFAVGQVALAPLQDQVEQIATDVFAGDLDSVFIVDETLRVIAHPDRERAAALAPAPAGSITHVVAQWRAGDPTRSHAFGAFRDYTRGGVRVFGTLRTTSEARWLIVAEQPQAKVYASIRRMQRAVIVTIALALAAAIAAAIAWSGRLAAPVKALVGFAQDLSHRRFDRRITLTTGDELETLATAMSGAAADLAAGEATIARERRIRGDLGRYLPVQLVDQIVKQEQDLRLGGERRPITVLFADVASFTSLVERLPPETVVAILNQLYTILTEVVFRHGGTIDKFIGDCVMAFWGAPQAQADHAARAVRAAEDMLRWLEVGNEAWQAEYGVTIHLAIGINTGPAVVGNFGSETRMEYTCIGDTVNVAARLEALARPQQILVSRATRDEAPRPDYVPLGTHQAHGRAEPVELYEVAP